MCRRKPSPLCCGGSELCRSGFIDFSNGEQRTYDITRLLDREGFSPLKNPGFFKNFTIAPGGYGLVWNDEIDISEYELWLHGM